MADRMNDRIGALSIALARFAKEHGRPNRIKCAELCSEYGAPSPMFCGRIGRGYRVELHILLGGYDGWGSAPMYEYGWFLI